MNNQKNIPDGLFTHAFIKVCHFAQHLSVSFVPKKCYFAPAYHVSFGPRDYVCNKTNRANYVYSPSLN